MLEKLMQGLLVNLLWYADYKTLYDTFDLNMMGDEDRKWSNLGVCLSRIMEWTQENKLKLNNDKFIVFTIERQRHKVTSTVYV